MWKEERFGGASGSIERVISCKLPKRESKEVGENKKRLQEAAGNSK